MTLFDFLSGAITLAFLVAALFFLRFWRRTSDGLFLAFAFAFWLLGLTQALLALTDFPVEERSFLYLFRLAAARRLRYSTLGMLQFLAPTAQFVLAVAVYGEPFTTAHAIAFGAIWAALFLYVAALARQARANVTLPE